MSTILWVRPMHVRNSEAMEQVSEDGIVLFVDGKLCVGRCGGCGKPILYESTFSRDEADGLLTCGECLEARNDG